MNKHPLGVATAIIIASVSGTGVVLYKVVIEDLRDQKSGLFSELQLTKQRVSSLESTLATYEGQCVSKLHEHSKESQKICNRQLLSIRRSAEKLALTNEKLLDEAQRKESALISTTEKLTSKHITYEQIQQLKIDEKRISDQIDALYTKHRELSREYGNNKSECEKNGKGFYSGNICERASMNRFEIDSVKYEIETTKIRLSQVQQQIVQQQSLLK